MIAALTKRMSSMHLQLRMVTSSLRRRPDFLIVGGQRCGTTFLYDVLRGHEAVLSATTKEVHFFDLNFHRGVHWYRAHFPVEPRSTSCTTVTGEASPYYLLHPRVPERVATLLPNVRLIALLRNPVDRAHSHYHHEVRKGRERETFARAIELEDERLRDDLHRLEHEPLAYGRAHHRFSYLARGRYAEQLERWFRHVPRHRFLVIKSEDLYADPMMALGRVTAFLGIPPLSRTVPARRNEGTYDRIDPALRLRLETYFEPHNERLRSLLGEGSTGWW